MKQRHTITFRFALDTIVIWAGEADQRYRVHQCRWTVTHMSSWAEYALINVEHPGRGIVCWVNEADLREEERGR